MRITGPASLLVTAALVAAVTGYASTPTQICAKSKLGAAAKKTRAKLKCYAKAAATGNPVDPICLTTAEDKFTAAFTKADDKGGCTSTTDTATIETDVDNCVNAIRTKLGSSAQPNPCLKGKLNTAGKKVGGKLKCYAKARVKGESVSQDCLQNVEDKFVLVWGKIEDKGGCVTVNDVSQVETTVDTSCVNPIVAALPAPTTTPPPSPTPTPCATAPPAWVMNQTTHNSTRANAQPPPNPPLNPLCWNPTVATDAQAWANGCNFSHNPNLGTLGYGENIYACAGSSGSCPGNPSNDAVVDWASEAANYDYATNTCSGTCGHYKQIVARKTTALGCGIKNCTANSPFPGFPNWTFVVCDYKPPGGGSGRPY